MHNIIKIHYIEISKKILFYLYDNIKKKKSKKKVKNENENENENEKQ